MKKILLIIIFAVFACVSNAQQNFVDSLWNVKNEIENAISFDKSRYSETVNSLIFCYISQSDYYTAKKIISEGINILRKNGSINDQPLRCLYCYSGLVSYHMKNYSEAMDMFSKVEQMCNEANSVDDEYIIAMCNAALVCGDLKQYEDMKNIMDAAVKRYESKYGSIFKISNELHYLLINNYGVANYNVGNYSLAKKCYRYVIDNCKGTLESNNALSLSLNNYGALLVRTGSYNKAAKFLKKTRTFNTDYAYVFAQNLTCMYFARWKIKKTAEILNVFNNIAGENVAYIFSEFPKTERENYWSNISMEVMLLNNFVAYFHKKGNGLKYAFNMTLFCKNLMLNSDKIIEDCINKSSDNNLKKNYSELKQLKHKYFFQTSDSAKAVELKNKIERQEDIVLHNINDLHTLLFNSSKKWENVKNSLSDGEYAVEYSQMVAPEMNGGPGTDTLYCAIVIGNKFKSPIIEFCIDVNIFDTMYFAKMNDPFASDQLYANRTTATTLYKFLFERIKQHMPDAKTIYYSLCGNLTQFNFDLFLDGNGTPLNQKYKMVRVSSTANIPQVKALNLKSAKTSTLYGGIDYKNSAENSDVAVRGVDFRNLPNTGNEVRNISRILTAANIKADTLCGENATEQSFKLLSGNSPDILHVATHGFYLEDDSEKPFAQSVNTYSAKESSMVLSGLALSGANNVWKGNFDLPNIEDGVLTAYEISQLDLSNTKLAVLSACETARGKIFPVDGVFGLQRAFKQAGAGAILMSLWKVDDHATALFMEHFYKFLLQSGDRHEALKLAQDEVKKQYHDPWYWAAWVMLD